VVGTIINPEEVSVKLGLTPTDVYVKGLPMPPRSSGLPSDRVSVDNAWTMRVETDDFQSLGEHLSILEKLLTQEIRLELKELSEEALVIVEIELIHEAGITIPKSIIQTISESGGSLDIDVRD
jgi:hypothetical protein